MIAIFIPVIALVLILAGLFISLPLGAIVMVAGGVIAVIALIALIFLARSTPAWEFILTKLKGDMVLTVVRPDRTAVFGRVEAPTGIAHTKRHGAFKVAKETVYNAGVPWAVAPSTLALTVDPRHAQLATRLKEMGARDIGDVATLDALDNVVCVGRPDEQTLKAYSDPNNPDSPPALKIPANPEPFLQPVPVKQETVSFKDLDDFVRYNVHPGFVEADIKAGIAAGLFGKETSKWAWLIFVGIAIFLSCLGVYVLLQYHPPAASPPPAQVSMMLLPLLGVKP